MKKIYALSLVILIMLSACSSSEPQETSIQTAIAQTMTAQAEEQQDGEPTDAESQP